MLPHIQLSYSVVVCYSACFGTLFWSDSIMVLPDRLVSRKFKPSSRLMPCYQFQREVQEQIDEAVGKSRSVSIKDRSQLPLVEALFIETTRITNPVPMTPPRIAKQVCVLDYRTKYVQEVGCGNTCGNTRLCSRFTTQGQ